MMLISLSKFGLARSDSGSSTREPVARTPVLGAAGSLPLIGELPYQGKDTREFDEVLFSAELNVPVKAYSQWGVHLLLVEARGEGGAPLAGEGAAPVDALRP